MSNLRIGTWITILHPTIVELVAQQNFDWICIDLEHSPYDRVGLQQGIALIQAYGKKAFVRVPFNSHLEIKYPLDAGADGIIIPMVNSHEEARLAVSSCMYPPLGNRGVGLARAQKFGFGFDDHLKKNLSDLEIFVQIEHINAVEQIEDIVKIDRLNGVFVGPYDLSGSMGIPGEFENSRMLEALEKVASATLDAGKFLGAHVIQPDFMEIDRFSAKGYNFLAFSLDTLFLGKKIKDELSHLGR